MKIFQIIFILFIFIQKSIATEVTVIELHNQSVDQLLINSLNLGNQNNEIEDEMSNDVDQNSDLKISNESNVIEEIQEEIQIDEIATIEINNENVSIEDIGKISNSWNQLNKDELIYFSNNINNIKSRYLKKELSSSLNLPSELPVGFTIEEFNNFLFDAFINLDERDNAYNIIQSFPEVENIDYNTIYKEFEINYLLSIYKVSEACDYRNEIKNSNINNLNFFLKVDIFCLILKEKFDEANLLNSLLKESKNISDGYFQYLLAKIQNINFKNTKFNSKINDRDVYLYSAMHRIGDIPLSENFLSLDPINLSMPILLSSSTDMNLRIKAANLAFNNNLLKIEGLSALYQAVDFTYDELNDPNNTVNKFKDNIEISMAYYYQLINIQILPISRLEAIINFWEYAEKNNLELTAFKLSKKSLITIEPNNQNSVYGTKIAKAYIYNENFEEAEKWLIFFENSLQEDLSLYELSSVRLLYNLFNLEETQSVTSVLFDNLDYMNKNLLNKNIEGYQNKNEILNIIFNLINKEKDNPFSLEKKIIESRPMPSFYITNKLRKASINKNDIELLLSISASLNGKKWIEIHPEQLRLIFSALKDYKNGNILNNILLEILKQIKII